MMSFRSLDLKKLFSAMVLFDINLFNCKILKLIK